MRSVVLILFVCLLSCRKETVQQHPEVNFTFTDNNGIAPDTITFRCNMSSPYVVTWDFGDGTKATGSEVAHIYKKQGYFRVSVHAGSEDGVGGVIRFINISPYKKLQVYQINGGVPSHKPDGSTWDPEPGATNPDLYFRIYNSEGIELTGTAATPHLPDMLSVQYPISPVVDLSDFDNAYSIKFLDYDFGNLEDDVLGSYYIRPSSFFRDSLPFPGFVSLTDSATNAAILVKFIWSN